MRDFSVNFGPAGEILSPGPAIDEVWHLHVLHVLATEQYEADCQALFGRRLPHFASRALDPKWVLAARQSMTEALYLATFGERVPDLWEIGGASPKAKQAARAEKRRVMMTEPFPVNVKFQTGGSKHFDVTLGTTVDELRETVRDSMSPRPSRVRLIFAGYELPCGQTLRDFNITKDATLHVVVCRRGRFPSPSSP